MKIRMHSMLYGHKTLNAKITVSRGKPQLIIENAGAISPLEYTKQGFRILEATRQEVMLMQKGGYELHASTIYYENK